jgi:hypothetical protein
MIMKKMLLTLTFLTVAAHLFAKELTGFPAVLSGSIAIEFQENGKFAGVIGKAYITEEAVEVVTFVEHRSGEVVPFAFIYSILEKENKVDSVYNIKCRNQLGVVLTGTIDLRKLNPKINLISDKGITLTNISDSGRKMKKEFLPRVDLGR